MKKKVKITMLPASDQTYQVKEGQHFIHDSREHDWGKLECLKCERVTVDGHAWNNRSIKTYINHLYVTVSQDGEPIRENDYYIDSKTNSIHIASDTHETWENERKIICTTDPKLTMSIWDDISTIIVDGKRREPDVKGVSQLQQSFLKEFVANPDGEWEVEYIEVFESPDPYPSTQQSSNRLKLTKDNSINIISEKVLDLDLKWAVNKLTAFEEELDPSIPLHKSLMDVLCVLGAKVSEEEIIERTYTEEEVIDLLMLTESNPLHEREWMHEWIRNMIKS